MENLIVPIIVGLLCFVFLIFFICIWCGRHKDFINRAQSISKGMTIDEVLNIMGEATSEEHDGNKLILIWEKSQWKGIQNGGTVTRGVKVVFVKDKVVSISHKNLNESTFW